MTCQYSTWPNLSALLTFQKKYSGAWALITVFQILNKIIFGSWNQKTFSNRREGFYLLNRDLELFNTLWCKIQCWILIWKCKTCEEICAFLLLTLLCTLSSFFFFYPCFILLSITAFCPLHMIFFPINKCYCFVFPFFSQYSSYCSTQPNLWEPFLLILIIMGCNISFMSLLAGAHRYVLSLSTFLSNSSFFVCVHIHHQEILLALYWKLLYYSHPSFKILSFYPIVSIGKFFIIMRMNY